MKPKNSQNFRLRRAILKVYYPQYLISYSIAGKVTKIQQKAKITKSQNLNTLKYLSI